MKDFSKTFKNKKIFLTGHTGFKGSWLCVWLQMMGAEVKGYSLKEEKNSLYSKIKPKLKIDSVYADIRNNNRLRKEILSFNPDFIFHLAAQAIVRESYINPVETFETNVTGTANVLDALRFLKKKCICIIVTTDKVYHNVEKNYEYKESDKLGGYDPYSASKAAAEIVTESYRLSFFNSVDFVHHKKSIATVRAGNVIGGGDYASDRIFPDIFRALSDSNTINVRNPKALRPWQHVLESLSGYLTLAVAMKNNPVKFATAYNIGPRLKDTCKVEELVKHAISYWGSGNYNNSGRKNEPHEAGLLKLNIRKAKKELGWSPAWNFEEAIKRTINWYKKSLSKNSNVFDLCEDDIKEYLVTRRKK